MNKRMLVVGNARDIKEQRNGDVLEWVTAKEFQRRHDIRLAALPMRGKPHKHEWVDGGFFQGVKQLDCCLCGIWEAAWKHGDKTPSQFVSSMKGLRR